MTSTQRAHLRKLAQKITPIFQIGKGGVGENLMKQVDEALEARELIKISLLNNSSEDIKEAAGKISTQTGSDIVQVVGHKITLYRRSKNNQTIFLN